MNIRALRFRAATSTNDLLKQMAAQGAAEGTLVAAESQSGGRGRLDHVWQSPEGGLYFSLLLRPGRQDNVSLLPLAAGLAVAEALRDEFGIQLELKWPNDLLWGGGKMGGILCEASRDGRGMWLVVGVGLNVNTERTRLPDRAVSLCEAYGDIVDTDYVLMVVAERVASCYGEIMAGGSQSVLERVRALDALLGRDITVEQADSRRISGKAAGIDAGGALLLETKQHGVVQVVAGDVHVEAIS